MGLWWIQYPKCGSRVGKISPIVLYRLTFSHKYQAYMCTYCSSCHCLLVHYFYVWTLHCPFENRHTKACYFWHQKSFCLSKVICICYIMYKLLFVYNISNKYDLKVYVWEKFICRSQDFISNMVVTYLLDLNSGHTQAQIVGYWRTSMTLMCLQRLHQYFIFQYHTYLMCDMCFINAYESL